MGGPTIPGTMESIESWTAWMDLARETEQIHEEEKKHSWTDQIAKLIRIGRQESHGHSEANEN